MPRLDIALHRWHNNSFDSCLPYSVLSTAWSYLHTPCTLSFCQVSCLYAKVCWPTINQEAYVHCSSCHDCQVIATPGKPFLPPPPPPPHTHTTLHYTTLNTQTSMKVRPNRPPRMHTDDVKASSLVNSNSCSHVRS